MRILEVGMVVLTVAWVAWLAFLVATLDSESDARAAEFEAGCLKLGGVVLPGEWSRECVVP